MTDQATIVQINVSGGGVPKLPVLEAEVGELGIAGDDHNDRLHHGGPERALCLFAVERIEALQAEGHPIGPGSAGENITTSGVDWDTVEEGTRLRLGRDVLIEVSRFTTPCSTIEGCFSDGDYSRLHHRTHQGWSRVYARVLAAGRIRAGDPVEVVHAGAVAPR